MTTKLYVSINLIFSLFYSFRVSEEDRAKRNKPKYRVDIYIGSDNDSRRINDVYLNKIKNWANRTFPEGYTLVKGEGYYNGISEDSILLHAFLSYDIDLKRSLKKLKRELKQDAILLVKSTVDLEVV